MARGRNQDYFVYEMDDTGGADQVWSADTAT